MAVVNVHNSDVDCCFLWSILAHLHPAQANRHRIQNYTRYASELNLDGLTFPLAIKDIPRFECQNPDIAIHCMAVDSIDNSFSIPHLSQARSQAAAHHHAFNPGQRTRPSKKHHYVYVKT